MRSLFESVGTYIMESLVDGSGFICEVFFWLGWSWGCYVNSVWLDLSAEGAEYRSLEWYNVAQSPAGQSGAVVVAVPDHPHQGVPAMEAGHYLVCSGD